MLPQWLHQIFRLCLAILKVEDTNKAHTSQKIKEVYEVLEDFINTYSSIRTYFLSSPLFSK